MARLLRKLQTNDAGLLRRHLLRLSPEARRLRFFGPVNDRFIVDYCRRVEWSRATIIGYFVGRTIRGAAELMPLDNGLPGTAELAVSVETGYQGRGIGTELVDMALVIARNRFIGRVYLFCLAENRVMQHLVRKFDAELSFGSGEAEGRVSPPWPTHLSLWREAAADGEALFRAAFRIPSP